MKRKILLALPTILYSPIYIAKQCLLSKEFAHIDFEYPPDAYKGKDELIDSLCLKESRGDDAILGVVDPIRVAFAKTNNLHEDLLIINGFIKKMCYWARGNYPEEGKELLSSSPKKYKIIVHPDGMTGFTIAIFDLFSKLKINENLENPKEIIKKLLYSKIKAGEENFYFEYSNFAKLSTNISCITTDPLVIQNKNQGISAMYGDNKDSLFNNSYMTAFVTSSKNMNNNKDKYIITDLLKGIKRGIEMIKQEPSICSKILYEYEDSFFCPKKIGWRTSAIENFLRYTAVGRDIYNDLSTFSEDTLRNSIEIWKTRADSLGESDKSEKLVKFETNLSKHFQPLLINKI